MADSSDLDYHITFPTRSSLASSEDDDKSPLEDGIEPTVVLLGWVGCQDKYLSKYSAIYEKRCVTVRYTAPTSDVFYNQQNLKTIAIKILEILVDLQLAENPVFFHVFSNGGGLVYKHITELIHTSKEYSYIQVYGNIFDSCPSPRKISIAVKAFMSSIGHINIFLRYLGAALLVVYLILLTVFRCMKSLVTTGSISNSSSDTYFRAMMNDEASCPQLYLYSKADDLVGHEAISSLIKHRESRGVRVLSTLWDDSLHVGHLRRHREAYIQQCHTFLDLCLGK